MKLDELKKLEAAATEGPWFVSPNDAPEHYGAAVVDTGRVSDDLHLNAEWNDANFIVAMRNNIRALIEVAEAARAYQLTHGPWRPSEDEPWKRLTSALSRLEGGEG